MKSLLIALIATIFTFAANAQKKVDAMADLMTKSSDTVNLPKGKTMVVMLPVRNRAGDDWRLAAVPSKLKFTESYLGQAGMLPNQEEPKLFFFKSTAAGLDSVRFMYVNPKAPPADPETEYRTVYVRMN
ncbi:MAG TPA: hypothetical protein VK907_14360 [Phnomibacter sp.]|nr:hypothetical protein [Phnomibacter sp.]